MPTAVNSPLAALVGKPVLVRTVTNYFTGRLVELDDGWLVLNEAAWVADTGRFANALAKGTLSEVEPYPGRCYIARGAIVDLCGWEHELPRKTK